MIIKLPDEHAKSPKLRIYFERTGGFFGRKVTSLVDTSQMPEQEAQNLRSMVAEAQFFDLPAVVHSAKTGADQFEYKVLVENDARRHMVQTTDTAAPDSLRPLLRQLTVLARSYPVPVEEQALLPPNLSTNDELTSREE